VRVINVRWAGLIGLGVVVSAVGSVGLGLQVASAEAVCIMDIQAGYGTWECRPSASFPSENGEIRLVFGTLAVPITIDKGPYGMGFYEPGDPDWGWQSFSLPGAPLVLKMRAGSYCDGATVVNPGTGTCEVIGTVTYYLTPPEPPATTAPPTTAATTVPPTVEPTPTMTAPPTTTGPPPTTAPPTTTGPPPTSSPSTNPPTTPPVEVGPFETSDAWSLIPQAWGLGLLLGVSVVLLRWMRPS